MRPRMRTWKLWVAVVFGIGISQIAQAAEPDSVVPTVSGSGYSTPAYPEVVSPTALPPSAAHTNAPNMFGDLFGARSSAITLSGLTYQFQQGFLSRNQLRAGIAVPLSLAANGVGSGNLNNPVTQLLVLNPNGTVRDFITEQVSSNAPILQYVAGGGALPVNPRAAATITGALNYLSVPPGVNAPNTSNVITSRRFFEYAQLVNPNVLITSLEYGSLSALYGNGPNGPEAIYSASFNDMVAVPITVADSGRITISVPTPGAGGVVGLLKMSEDNSPFPRDRLIFNYDYFNNVPMTVGGGFGLPVNRYQFGLEKTFLEGRASFEVRLPFARTLSSTSTFGDDSLNTELGNLRLTVKGLLRRGEKVNISGGLGVALPTADDIVIRGGGTDLIRIENQAVQLSPFLALMYTPNERLFAQVWYSFCFDTVGNGVNVNPYFFGVGPNIGNISAAPLMSIDGQIGYWVYQSGQGWVRGVAPFAELHYACNASKGTLVDAGNGFLIGDTGNYEELNLTTGVTTLLAENSTLAVGAAFPLLNSPGRTFDFQVGIRFNYYFGASAGQRSRSTVVNTFGP